MNASCQRVKDGDLDSTRLPTKKQPSTATHLERSSRPCLAVPLRGPLIIRDMPLLSRARAFSLSAFVSLHVSLLPLYVSLLSLSLSLYCVPSSHPLAMRHVSTRLLSFPSFSFSPSLSLGVSLPAGDSESERLPGAKAGESLLMCQIVAQSRKC